MNDGTASVGVHLHCLAVRCFEPKLGKAEHTLFLLMIFFEKTLRDWKVTLDPMADRKPVQLKVASEADARATPATMLTVNILTMKMTWNC